MQKFLLHNLVPSYALNFHLNGIKNFHRNKKINDKYGVKTVKEYRSSRNYVFKNHATVVCQL